GLELADAGAHALDHAGKLAAGRERERRPVWYLPAMIRVSKKLSPTIATAATTSPGPATGAGTSPSTRSSGVPKRWQRTAFMGAARGGVGGLAGYSTPSQPRVPGAAQHERLRVVRC